jgi:biotin carboxylase
MSTPSYVLIIDHGRLALQVLSRVREVGFQIAVLGGDRVVASMADKIFQSVDEVIASRCDFAGILCFADQSKTRERDIGLKLGVSVVTEHTLFCSRDKRRLREILSETGADDLVFQFIPDNQTEIQIPDRFPIVMKPNLGFASTGVAIARDQDSFHKNLSRIRRLNGMALSRTLTAETGALCEPYICGMELAIDSITVGKTTKIFGISHRLYAGEDNFQDFVYHTEPETFQKFEKELTPLIKNTISALGYQRGPSHIEVRFDSSTGRWHVLDVGLRVGAGGNIGLMIERASGIPYLKLAISASLGLLSEQTLENLNFATSRYAFFMVIDGGTGGRVKAFRGTEVLYQNPSVAYYAFGKEPGEWLLPYPNGADYPAIVVGDLATLAEMHQLISEINHKVGVTYES